MTCPPTLAELMADLGELDLWCEACHHHAIMPVTALLIRYAADPPFPEFQPVTRSGLTFDSTGRHAER